MAAPIHDAVVLTLSSGLSVAGEVGWESVPLE
jgi:hypothetical protein